MPGDAFILSYYLCPELRGNNYDLLSVNLSYNHVLNPRLFNYERRQSSRQGTVKLHTQEHSHSATCCVTVANFVFRRQNDDGREDGDAEEHITARMRWLRQEDH
jgi:hypothetical protein